MKRYVITAITVFALLITLAGALALWSGPYTQEEAQAALNDPRFYNELGFKFSEQGRMQEAQRAFERAVELDSRYERARSNLATAAFHNQEYETAIEQLRWLTFEFPGNENYRFDLAQNLVSQARYVDGDVAKFEEGAAIYESLGDFPHAVENAVIVRTVLAEN